MLNSEDKPQAQSSTETNLFQLLPDDVLQQIFADNLDSSEMSALAQKYKNLRSDSRLWSELFKRRYPEEYEKLKNEVTYTWFEEYKKNFLNFKREECSDGNDSSQNSVKSFWDKFSFVKKIIEKLRSWLRKFSFL